MNEERNSVVFQLSKSYIDILVKLGKRILLLKMNIMMKMRIEK